MGQRLALDFVTAVPTPVGVNRPDSADAGGVAQPSPRPWG